MAFVYEVNGQRVEFDKEPSEADIDEAAAQLGGSQPTSGAGGSFDVRGEKIIPQITKGLYESVPFGKSVVGMLPNAQQIEQNMATTPEPQGIAPTLGRGLAEAAPVIATMAPFMGGAQAVVGRGILADMLGFGAYSGTRAALGGANTGEALKETVGGMGMGALFGGVGKLGANIIPKQIPGAERIGGALGGAALGKIVGGDKEALTFGTLGGMFPQTRQPIRGEATTQMAQGIMNNLLKPSKSLKKYGANPARGLVKEGITGNNWQEMSENAQTRIYQLDQLKENIKMDARNMNVRVDIKPSESLKPLYDLMAELKKSPDSNKTYISQLENNINDLVAPGGKYRKLNDLSIDQAYEFRNQIKSLTGGDIFDTSNAKRNNVLLEAYHNVVERINNSGVSPELKTVNKRMQDLINGKTAIEDASKRNPSIWKLFPFATLGGMVGSAGGPIGMAQGVAGGMALKQAVESPIGASVLTKLLAKKYPTQFGEVVGGGPAGQAPFPNRPPESPAPPKTPVKPTPTEGKVTLPTLLLRDKSKMIEGLNVRESGNLVGYGENAPKGTWDNFKKSIREEGIKKPIEIYVDNAGKIEIVEGTHRLLAAEELGIKDVPVKIRGYAEKLSTPTGEGQKVLKGLVKGKESESLFHETGVSSLRYLFGMGDASGMYVSDTPDLAIGQGGKGVKIEFDKTKLLGDRGSLGKVNKPGLEFSEKSGIGTEYRLIGGRTGLDKIKKITLEPDIKMDKVTKALLQRNFNSKKLESGGWELTPKR